MLRDMESELRHRQVPRARSLLHQVRIAMKATEATILAAGPEPEVIGGPAVVPAQSELGIFDSTRSVSQGQKSSVLIEKKPANQAQEKEPAVPISEAYKLLKANPGASWESIESVRRQLVQRASPASVVGEQRLRLQQDAERINAAYKAIASDRIGTR